MDVSSQNVAKTAGNALGNGFLVGPYVYVSPVETATQTSDAGKDVPETADDSQEPAEPEVPQYESELAAFQARFSPGLNRLAGRITWLYDMRRSERGVHLDQLGKKVIKADRRTLKKWKAIPRKLELGDLEKAATASFDLAKDLWERSFYIMAQDVFIYGAALKAGLAKRVSFDLRDGKVRDPLFDILVKEGVAGKVDTPSMLSERLPDTQWVLFKSLVGGRFFGTHSHLLIGAGIVRRTFSPLRMSLASNESGIGGEHLVDEKIMLDRMNAELGDLEKMRAAGLPVVDVHEVNHSRLCYFRDFVKGLLVNDLNHPLSGLSDIGAWQAMSSFYAQVVKVQRAGLWRGAYMSLMRRSMALDMSTGEAGEWVVFDSLPRSYHQ